MLSLWPKNSFSFSQMEGSTSPAPTCAVWILMISCVAGWNVMLIHTPFQSITTLCSILWYSTSDNSVANSGCLMQTFCLLVLTRIVPRSLAIVIAKHLLTTMPNGKLWYSTCLTRNAVLHDNLLVLHRKVIIEFPGILISYFLLPTETFPNRPSFQLKYHCLLDRSPVFLVPVFPVWWYTYHIPNMENRSG